MPIFYDSCLIRLFLRNCKLPRVKSNDKTSLNKTLLKYPFSWFPMKKDTCGGLWDWLGLLSEIYASSSLCLFGFQPFYSNGWPDKMVADKWYGQNGMD